MKCEVQLIKEEFVLVSLQAHCVGRLAYLPAKRVRRVRGICFAVVNSRYVGCCWATGAVAL